MISVTLNRDGQALADHLRIRGERGISVPDHSWEYRPSIPVPKVWLLLVHLGGENPLIALIGATFPYHDSRHNISYMVLLTH